MKRKYNTLVFIVLFALGAAILWNSLPSGFMNDSSSPAYFRIMYSQVSAIAWTLWLGLSKVGLGWDPISGGSSNIHPPWQDPLEQTLGFFSPFIVFFLYGVLFVFIFRRIARFINRDKK